MKTGTPEARLTRTQQASAVLLFPLNLAAAALEVIFCIPWAGRVLKMLWNSLLTLLHFIIGMGEFLVWNLGFRPEKKFKVSVVVLSDEENQPVEEIDNVIGALERTRDIFFDIARVRLVPAAHIPKALSKKDQPNPHWIRVAGYQESKNILDVGCDDRAILEDLSIQGTSYQWINLRKEFFTGFRRVFGYGAPVTIFIVRSVEKKAGCSLGWFSDYVTVPRRRLRSIPHELGHALSLLHRSDPQNLLYPGDSSARELTSWQVAVIRSSRHVTLI
jgi:hypothetical protein